MFECLELKEEILFRVRNTDLVKFVLIEQTEDYELWGLVDCSYMTPEKEILKEYINRYYFGEKYKVRNINVLKKNIITILIQFYVERMRIMEQDLCEIHQMIKEEGISIKDIDYEDFNDYIWTLHIDLGFEKYESNEN